MDDEETISRMTRLLEMGGTMLATHHDCGTPLFRYKGQIVCPICSFSEVDEVQAVPLKKELNDVGLDELVAPKSEGISNNAESSVTDISSNEIGAKKVVSRNPLDMVIADLREDIFCKLRELSEKMRDEKDLSRLESQLHCIEEALKVLSYLNK